MSNIASVTGAEDILKNLDALPEVVLTVLKQMYGVAAEATYSGSQVDVPVDKGDLKASGHIVVNDEGAIFSVEVVYGDGNGYGTKYGEADGVSWFMELGTMFIAPRPYLSPHFDQQSNNLMDDLTNLF